MEPFVKIAGGKRRLAAKIVSLFSEGFAGTYHEPFAGGAAIFFALRPRKAVLSDMNGALVEAYRAVRDAPSEVWGVLNRLADDEDTYMRVRARNCRVGSPVRRAAEFLYLNATCFNGLWRVNREGFFNVPYGRRGLSSPVVEVGTLLAASEALRNTPILHEGFDQLMVRGVGRPARGDVVYFDPPYAPVGEAASFVGYTKEGFGSADQERLATLAEYLRGVGVRVVLSASDTPFVRGLYPARVWKLEEVEVRRSVGAGPATRKKVGELLIY